MGVSYEHAQYLTELPLEREKMLIDINVTATTRMTRVVLPAMVRGGARGAVLGGGAHRLGFPRALARSASSAVAPSSTLHRPLA